MGDWARVIDGNVMEFGAEPDAFEIPDTSEDASPGDMVWVSTPAGSPTPPALLRKGGWLPVEDVYEEPDPEHPERIYGEPGFEVMATKVKRTFPLIDPPSLDDPQGEQITALEQRVMVLEKYVEQYQPMIDEWTNAPSISEIDSRILYASVQALRGEVAALRAEVRGK